MAGNVVSATLRGGLFTRIVGRRLLYFQEIPSTMDEAARLAEQGAEEGTVVVAENQTAGRGRQGRTWVSRGGNLYFSIIFRPAPDVLPLISMLAGVAAARAIRRVTALDPRLKWPNDVMLHGKKVAGILVESVVRGDRADYAVLGIGINVSLDTGSAGEISALAISLDAAVGPPRRAGGRAPPASPRPGQPLRPGGPARHLPPARVDPPSWTPWGSGWRPAGATTCTWAWPKASTSWAT